MIQTNWHVITGAPSSGKTTLINRLAELGYHTAPEVARSYIKYLLDHHKTLDEIEHDSLKLQRKILSIMLRREKKLPIDELIFFDRGMPDSLAYFNFHHLHDPEVIKACSHMRYKKIFYCQGLPVVQDDIRKEDELTAKFIGELIHQAYIRMDYELIELPPVSIEERLNIILTNIDRK